MSKLEDLLNGLLLTPGRVLEVEDIGTHFRRIAVDLGDVGFRPGDKVQIRVGPWTHRTFTPFTLASSRAMQLLVFHHAPSPAGRWVRALSAGDPLELFGPRKSILFEEVPADAALFGDETSLAAAIALRSTGSAHEAFLETDHGDQTLRVLDALGASGVTLVRRTPGDDHLRELGERLRSDARPLVLTGKAQSIQAMRSHLGSARRRVAKTKAYWAVGRSGLD